MIPGGRAPEYLRTNKKVLDIVKHFMKKNKPVAAICHGPQILVAADVIKNRLCTAYPSLKPDIIKAGAKWGEPNETLTNAHVQGNLVTAAAWPGHPEWMRKFLALMGVEFKG